MKKTTLCLTLTLGFLLACWGCSRKWNNPLDPDNNKAPSTIQALYPADNAQNVPVTFTLAWTGVDPNSNDTLKYDVYFDQVNPPSVKVATAQGDSVISERGLDHNVPYYWKVVARDNHGAEYSGPVWTFTTAPGTVTPLLDLVSIRDGYFLMGTTDTLPSRGQEYPEHRVYLNSYKINRYEITNAQYKCFMDDSGYYRRSYWSADGWTWRTQNNLTAPPHWNDGMYNNGPSFPTRPVVFISWYEAQAFAKWSGTRLPTEAEWERAGRGLEWQADRRWAWGDTFDAAKLNCIFNIPPDTFTYTSPVGYFTAGASPDVVMDLCGNVYEWAADWYDPFYYRSQSTWNNPTGPTTGTQKVVRSGSWDKDSSECRLEVRYGDMPYYQGMDNGFRVAQ